MSVPKAHPPSSDAALRIAIVFSIVVHAALFVRNPTLLRLTRRTPVETELSYVHAPEPPPSDQDTRVLNREPLSRATARPNVDRSAPPPFIDKETIFNKTRTLNSPQGLFLKPLSAKSDVIAVKKTIVMPALDLDKIDNPSYLSYYQIVREKIRRAAYQNYSQADTGEVYLSFILSREGELREILLNEDRSSSSLHLRDVALRSIRDAEPFPRFPKELDYERLSFNVEISFQLE